MASDWRHRRVLSREPCRGGRRSKRVERGQHAAQVAVYHPYLLRTTPSHRHPVSIAIWMAGAASSLCPRNSRLPTARTAARRAEPQQRPTHLVAARDGVRQQRRRGGRRGGGAGRGPAAVRIYGTLLVGHVLQMSQGMLQLLHLVSTATASATGASSKYVTLQAAHALGCVQLQCNICIPPPRGASRARALPSALLAGCHPLRAPRRPPRAARSRRQRSPARRGR